MTNITILTEKTRLTAKQAAEILGLSVGRTREIARANDLVFYRNGKQGKMAILAGKLAKYMGCKVQDL